MGKFTGKLPAKRRRYTSREIPPQPPRRWTNTDYAEALADLAKGPAAQPAPPAPQPEQCPAWITGAGWLARCALARHAGGDHETINGSRRDEDRTVMPDTWTNGQTMTTTWHSTWHGEQLIHSGRGPTEDCPVCQANAVTIAMGFGPLHPCIDDRIEP